MSIKMLYTVTSRIFCRNGIKSLFIRHNSMNALISPVKQQRSKTLSDSHGRFHNYLRISLSERCNLRCQYCMPEEGVTLTENNQLLSNEEIIRLAKLFVNEGVDKIRLTGGEPLVRKDLVDICYELNSIGGLKSLGITSNGLVGKRKFPLLVDAGVTHLNLSLDTLVPEKFEFITRRKGWHNVMNALEIALDLPFVSVKLNCVVMNGLNEDEIVQFAELTKDKKLEVRFIEYMPFDGNKWNFKKFVPFHAMLDKISAVYPDIFRMDDRPNDTCKVFKIPNFKGEVGFITSMSKNFCSSCNRLRVTADGNLKVCLFGPTEVSLRDAIRDEGMTDEQLTQIISAAVKNKKKAHAAWTSTHKTHFELARSTRKINIGKLKCKNRNHSRYNQNQARYGIACLESFSKSPFNRITLVSRFIKTIREMYMMQSRCFYLMSPTQQTRYVHTSGFRQNSFLSHVSTDGSAKMVDVSDKRKTKRYARATSEILLNEQIIEAIQKNLNKKGDVITVAKIAGIMGGKKTSELIPLCHNINLSSVNIDIEIESPYLKIVAEVNTSGRTGVEMEALTAVSVASLTIYDMCKSMSHEIVIQNTRLQAKTGGKTDFHNYCDTRNNDHK